MKFKNESLWEQGKSKNTDFYGAGVYEYAEAWANLMEKEMSEGKKLEDIAKQTSHDANTMGITSFMYGCAVGILSEVWEHGETLRRWHNLDRQNGGFGGSTHLSHLHKGIEKFLDELSGAGPGDQGKSHDVKVTVTIESLGKHEHRLVTRNSFSGLGVEDNRELKKDILKVEEPTEVTVLKGEEEFGTKEQFNKRVQNLNRTLPKDYLQDIHDAMLLARRTGDVTKLDEAMKSLQRSIDKEDN